jgi:hypothetical protein
MPLGEGEAGTQAAMASAEKDTSLRARNVLMQVYGGESIFEEPEKTIVLGPHEFMKLKNVGRKKVQEFTAVLESLRYVVSETAFAMHTNLLSPRVRTTPVDRCFDTTGKTGYSSLVSDTFLL